MGVKILAAEDDDDVRRVVETKLGAEFEVETARDGREAWTHLTEHQDDPPDLVVLDVMMPDLDGFSVLERIRNHDSLEDVPVLMLTSRSREEDVLRALEAGADDFVAKPFSAAELMGRVERMLEEG
jgi:sigma-B regulation protein RsbU (phosphoserine phosphatase)